MAKNKLVSLSSDFRRELLNLFQGTGSDFEIRELLEKRSLRPDQVARINDILIAEKNVTFSADAILEVAERKGSNWEHVVSSARRAKESERLHTALAIETLPPTTGQGSPGF